MLGESGKTRVKELRPSKIRLVVTDKVKTSRENVIKASLVHLQDKHAV